MLPCVLSFIEGVSVDRLIGFEGLGYTPDTFTTKDLEARLLACGIIRRSRAVEDAGIGIGSKRLNHMDTIDDGDGDEWD